MLTFPGIIISALTNPVLPVTLFTILVYLFWLRSLTRRSPFNIRLYAWLHVDQMFVVLGVRWAIQAGGVGFAALQ